MENNAELVRLEQFVDTLLNKYNDLKDRFHALEATLRERDSECASLKDDIAALKDERSEVGSRVSGLLDRIEQWEAEEESSAQTDTAEEDKQGGLFDSEFQENN